MDDPEHVLAAQVDAWNTGDLDGFCAAYAQDATYLTDRGVTRGREALLANLRQRYPDPASMGRLQVGVRQLEVSGDLATAVVDWSVATDVDSVSGAALLGFRRTEDGWRLAWDATLAFT
ncbi:MAG: nuclear transport factor 2 family protein [Alphaproteobacteria bacterium]|nr:nuclear transport factor 2 family protein [Alphaproteobacteria bacterium]